MARTIVRATLIAIAFAISACGAEEKKSDGNSNSGQEQGGGERITVSLKSGLKALALTKAGFGLTGSDESNLKALNEDGELVFPFAEIVNGLPQFEHVIVTDKQVLLAAKRSGSGLALTQRDDSGSGTSGSGKLVFKDLKMKEGERLDGIPDVLRINRETGMLQVLQDPDFEAAQAATEAMYGLTSSSSKKYASDGVGNFYFTDSNGVQKIAADGQVTNVFPTSEPREIMGLSDGSLLVRADKMTWLKANGTKSVIEDQDYGWAEVVDGKLYCGTNKAIYRNGAEIVNYEEVGVSTSLGQVVGTVVGGNVAWVVYKTAIHKVSPTFEEVDHGFTKIEAATSYNGKLVLVGDGRVELDGEEVGTYSGSVNSISLKGSVLMVAAGDVTEVNLQTKEVKDLNLGEVKQIEAL